MSSKPGIIFDVDGTLWDSSEKVAESFARTMSKYDKVTVKCDAAAISSLMGAPMSAFRDHFFGAYELEEATRITHECEDNELAYLKDNLPECYEGVHDTIAKLHEEGYPLFIVSNAQQGYIELVMESADCERFITDYACYGDNEESKDVNIRLVAQRNDLAEYYYVGDIQSDYDATVAAGGRFIHAAYGFGTIKQEVPRINDIRELPALMKTL